MPDRHATYGACVRPADAQALLRLGGQLRTAHRELDAAQLRALSHEQHRVICVPARETTRLAGAAGERSSESMVREIELSHEQHRVICVPARETTRLAGAAGERSSESMVREIEQIHHALLADEDAGRQ